MALLADTSDPNLAKSLPGHSLTRQILAPNQENHSQEHATPKNNYNNYSNYNNYNNNSTTKKLLRHNFPKLPSNQQIRQIRDQYVGPTTESNWVLPGHLLVGAYPGVANDEENMATIWSILNCRITTFVCLQVEYPGPDVTEDMWRTGKAIRPYFTDVKEVIAHVDSMREVNKEYSVKNITNGEKLDFVHVPIVDCSVTDDTTIYNLCVNLVERIARGEILYVHCWGGHGRTGTAICIMLHLMYKLSADQCLDFCQFVHDLRKIPINVGSPQTKNQRDQVIRVINNEIKKAKNEEIRKAEVALEKEKAKEVKEAAGKLDLVVGGSTLVAIQGAGVADNGDGGDENSALVPSKPQTSKPAKRNLREMRDEAREKRRQKKEGGGGEGEGGREGEGGAEFVVEGAVANINIKELGKEAVEVSAAPVVVKKIKAVAVAVVEVEVPVVVEAPVLVAAVVEAPVAEAAVEAPTPTNLSLIESTATPDATIETEKAEPADIIVITAAEPEAKPTTAITTTTTTAIATTTATTTAIATSAPPDDKYLILSPQKTDEVQPAAAVTPKPPTSRPNNTRIPSPRKL